MNIDHSQRTVPMLLLFATLFSLTLVNAIPKAISGNTCFDLASPKRCSFWQQNGACITHANRLQGLCAKTCEFCGKEICSDLGTVKRCGFLKRYGACETHKHLMRRVCAKTCQLCEVNRLCEYKVCPADKFCNLDNDGNTFCDCRRHCERRHQYKNLGKVCSSDGRTFQNYCKMKHTACREGVKLAVAHYGECPVQKECKDSGVEARSGLCLAWKRSKACNLYKDTMLRYCAKTCNLCHLLRAPSPTQSCINSKYGCCWDGKEASGPDSQGCRECVDTYPNLCLTFMHDCNSVEPKNSVFMRNNCPATCQFCVPPNGTPGKDRASVNRFISIIQRPPQSSRRV